MNYKKYRDSIIERLLEIIKKISQLKEAARRAIQKLQAKQLTKTVL